MSREAEDFVSKIGREVRGFACEDYDLLHYLVDELIDDIKNCDRRHVTQRMADALATLPANVSIESLRSYLAAGVQAGVLT